MKGKNRVVIVALLLLYILSVGLRLFASQSSVFYSTDSYFDLRQINSILETGKPIFHDSLAWGGRDFAFSPVYHYIMAGFVSFFGFQALYFIPAMLVSLSVFFIYLITKRVLKSEWIGILAAASSILIPILITETTNTLSPITLAIPLMLACTYFFLDIEKNIVPFSISLFLLSFVHPVSLVWLAGLLLYLVLMIAEELKQNKGELEVGLFSVFFLTWAQLILYKRVFVTHGWNVIWQNIPSAILSEYFAKLTLFDAVISLGILPCIGVAFIVGKFLFREKNKDIYFISGLVGAPALLAWFRLIPLNAGLLLTGLFMVPLSAVALSKTYSYLLTTRVSHYSRLIILGIMMVFVVTSGIPAIRAVFQQGDVTADDLAAMQWLSTSPSDALVASLPDSGELITSLANRSAVMDNNFLLVKDANPRYDDMRRLFLTSFQIEAVTIMDKYDADYIYVSSSFARDSKYLEYVDDGCFRKEFEQGSAMILLKKSSCHARVQ